MNGVIPMVVEASGRGERVYDIYLHDFERDYYMDASAAMEYGIVDQVLAGPTMVSEKARELVLA